MTYYGDNQWKCEQCGQNSEPPHSIDLAEAIARNLQHFRRRGASKKGGLREGAGRKAVRGKTEVMRIPCKYKSVVEALILHLDDTAHLNRHCKSVESQPVFFRSLQEHPQNIVFRTDPIDMTAKRSAASIRSPLSKGLWDRRNRSQSCISARRFSSRSPRLYAASTLLGSLWASDISQTSRG